MTGRQIAIVLALCLIMPVVCGMFPACTAGLVSISDLSKFVVGGMIGIATAQSKKLAGEALA